MNKNHQKSSTTLPLLNLLNKLMRNQSKSRYRSPEIIVFSKGTTSDLRLHFFILRDPAGPKTRFKAAF